MAPVEGLLCGEVEAGRLEPGTVGGVLPVDGELVADGVMFGLKVAGLFPKDEDET